MSVSNVMAINPIVVTVFYSKTTYVNLPVALKRKERESPKSVLFIFWGSWTSVPNFMEIYPVVADLFQFGLEWWSDQQLPY